ncbi:uncharacterized protein ColSpa_03857 [Colletotrichum spaethianum]|uniref:Uncharacterized protein n=1 Tax=Colletotrichum spaethianum TaxID=700344 RepID=A0AA37L7X7_9PEZI|nr:uncharacterized protein ColSpa_03857 [Colletotrichum spaethianum]GKT43676.1 hypothetical protein ColSpa_03857 [Colletotrichum spaethianum]
MAHGEKWSGRSAATPCVRPTRQASTASFHHIQHLRRDVASHRISNKYQPGTHPGPRATTRQIAVLGRMMLTTPSEAPQEARRPPPRDIDSTRLPSPEDLEVVVPFNSQDYPVLPWWRSIESTPTITVQIKRGAEPQHERSLDLISKKRPVPAMVKPVPAWSSTVPAPTLAVSQDILLQ